MSAESDYDSIDRAMQGWQQGDAILSDVPFFVHLADIRSPLTPEAINYVNAAGLPDTDDTLIGIPTVFPGLVIVTQTCDIVRGSRQQPFVEVSPLVEVAPNLLEEVVKLRRPASAYIPALRSQHLVADLRQTMTIEKSVLMSLAPVRGCPSAQDQRRFADALAKKRSRFAFPDDFTPPMRLFGETIRRRHGKNSEEGRLASALADIRVLASPDWYAPKVILSFLFILSDDATPPTAEDNRLAGQWLVRLQHAGRFVLDDEVPFRICFLSDLDAAEYLDSDRIYFDDLSRSG